MTLLKGAEHHQVFVCLFADWWWRQTALGRKNKRRGKARKTIASHFHFFGMQCVLLQNVSKTKQHGNRECGRSLNVWHHPGPASWHLNAGADRSPPSHPFAWICPADDPESSCCRWQTEKKRKRKKEGVLVISFIRYPPAGHCGSYLLDLLFLYTFFK